MRKKGRGGRRSGAGRKDVLEEAIRTYRSLETLRLPEDAPEDLKKLAGECRQKMLDIMRKPTRHAQAQLAAARALLEEACGKVADQLKIDDHKVTVEIRENPRPPKAPAEEEKKT